MNNREDFIKFIPKPKNEDVILYDISLKDFIDIDVLSEYDKLYPDFISKRNRYISLREEITTYEKTIDQIYLFNPSWSESDYLTKLQDAKKTYSVLFKEIKKSESNIEILNKKIKGIDEKIQIQISKENRKNEEKSENINKEIEKSKEQMSHYKILITAYKETLNILNEKISDNEEEFEMLAKMETELTLSEHKCKMCGTLLKQANENSFLYKRIYKNLEKNKKDLIKLMDQKEKIELNLSFYESEFSRIKKILNNDINFKKENKNTYRKKSIEVLKLEALRDEMLNKISEFEKKIKHDANYHSKKFIELKDNIMKYENSLNNLNKIKIMKEDLSIKIKEFKVLEKELKIILKTLNEYIKFLSIFYKIYEQKANEYSGNDFKFSFFRIEDYKIIPILNIKYKGVEYSELSAQDKQYVDKTLIEKFSIYF